MQGGTLYLPFLSRPALIPAFGVAYVYVATKQTLKKDAYASEVTKTANHSY